MTTHRKSGVPPEVSHLLVDAPDSNAIKKRKGVHLPHWTKDGATYAITFRLGDSLPQTVLETWLAERRDIVRTAQQMGRPLAKHEEERLRQLHSKMIEDYLDASHGECWMRQPQIADLVANALQFFDGNRYRLHAWCVMPNHVHVVVESLDGNTLPKTIHSWKSFTAKAANRLLSRSGNFWQDEYYDHLIRDDEDYAHALRYVAENPKRAGLKKWRWVWSVRSDIVN